MRQHIHTHTHSLSLSLSLSLSVSPDPSPFPVSLPSRQAGAAPHTLHGPIIGRPYPKVAGYTLYFRRRSPRANRTDGHW
ncbi:hypothetical protein BU24DRAFT_287249 [Aaosphaeria arxii CBS 175.79]|uniref:Secreted protein n=1 Tax=Aaosphaeria arxii CBS 175.79 TaxID=1450172 RepID=A0A6A5XEP0_9PLEO|nr:uncharacterized protein BU24DRAFT_287249 [Aaosphaeria arxii CBS 175.79]KAF2011695.1 hypothetical protein BU24DRAFT_287249 [Aaosphaeria arxii CBS 175.79]